MIIKVFLLMAIMGYFNQTSNGTRAAIFWGGAMLIAGLIFDGLALDVLIGAAISFAIALAVFKTLEHLDGHGGYWPAFAIGIGVLIVLA